MSYKECKYCAKRNKKCKHLEQRWGQGSFCLHALVIFKEDALINKKSWGNILTPDWCPLKEEANDEG